MLSHLQKYINQKMENTFKRYMCILKQCQIILQVQQSMADSKTAKIQWTDF